MRLRSPSIRQDSDRADWRAAIADAANDILGVQGSRGLTHRAIDKHLGYAEGTTSAYFRRCEDLVMARRQPDTDRLLRASFSLRNEKTQEVFRRLGTAHPKRAAIQFEVLLRGAFFTASFVPDILDDSGRADAGFVLREINAAMQA